MLNKQIVTVIVDRPNEETDKIVSDIIKDIYVNKGMELSSAIIKKFQTKSELGETITEKVVIENAGYSDVTKILLAIPYAECSTKMKIVLSWKKCK